MKNYVNQRFNEEDQQANLLILQTIVDNQKNPEKNNPFGEVILSQLAETIDFLEANTRILDCDSDSSLSALINLKLLIEGEDYLSSSQIGKLYQLQKRLRITMLMMTPPCPSAVPYKSSIME